MKQKLNERNNAILNSWHDVDLKKNKKKKQKMIKENEAKLHKNQTPIKIKWNRAHLNEYNLFFLFMFPFVSIEWMSVISYYWHLVWMLKFLFIFRLVQEDNTLCFNPIRECSYRLNSVPLYFVGCFKWWKMSIITFKYECWNKKKLHQQIVVSCKKKLNLKNLTEKAFKSFKTFKQNFEALLPSFHCN